MREGNFQSILGDASKEIIRKNVHIGKIVIIFMNHSKARYAEQYSEAALREAVAVRIPGRRADWGVDLGVCKHKQEKEGEGANNLLLQQLRWRRQMK